MVPVELYSYKHEWQYLDEYRSGYFAITHMKGGWDCFRHLEVLYSGAIPLMHDSRIIPEFSMVHYPKNAMARTFDEFITNPRKPSEATRSSYLDHFNQQLTTEAMARYVLRSAGLISGGRILFIDENLAEYVVYLSLLTLISLCQLLDFDVTPMLPAPYLWSDWKGDTTSLYGRGFGYS